MRCGECGFSVGHDGVGSWARRIARGGPEPLDGIGERVQFRAELGGELDSCVDAARTHVAAKDDDSTESAVSGCVRCAGELTEGDRPVPVTGVQGAICVVEDRPDVVTPGFACQFERAGAPFLVVAVENGRS